MTSTAGNGSNTPQTWSSRLRSMFALPTSPGGPGTGPDPDDILPPEKRKAAMSRLDPLEEKLARWALILAAAAALGAAIYINSANKVTKSGKNSIAVAPDAWLLAGIILLLCALGGFALWKKKRSFVVFSLFLIGFAFTLPFGLIGFVFILLGGWLLLRAWRINKYGTTNAKLIAREAANRPRGRDRSTASKSGSKAQASSGGPRKPPTASKRYTPKSPPRKKIPKPTE
ncbi:MAG TPA: hypothetical protein VMF35_07365 [Acidimicrobiales bacterium]|nr:hypothetical protein [Acidimicrobiales bacterium]